jgi:eukaryotic-like serine/threonine-protein kinase
VKADAPPDPIRIGEVLADKYRVDSVIGRGGMGVVLLATHIQLDDRVAIKTLRGDLADVATTRERFLREGRAARRLKSDHAVKVLDIDVTPTGHPFLVMEFLEGCDLADLMRQDRPSIAQAVDYVLQACDAIAEAHSIGIIHRDLKPANLFSAVRPGGRRIVKVLDFGIAKLSTEQDARVTATGRIVGSAAYMSPEQLQALKDVDQRTDIWALGVILFELLTGVLPFKGSDLPQMCTAILMHDATPLRKARGDAPEALEQIIQRCLQRDRDARFSSVAELAAALAAFGSADTASVVQRVQRIGGDGAKVKPFHAQRLSTQEALADTVLSTSASNPGLANPVAARTGGVLALAAAVVIGAAVIVAAILLRRPVGDVSPPRTVALSVPATAASAATPPPPPGPSPSVAVGAPTTSESAAQKPPAAKPLIKSSIGSSSAAKPIPTAAPSVSGKVKHDVDI